MKKYEASARTVEEAIELGLKELGVSIGDVDVQVLEEGSKGLFGLFGSRLAKVSLTVKDEEEDLLEGLIPEEKEAAPAAPKETMPKQAAPEKKAEKQESPAAAQPAEEEPAKKESSRPAPVKRVAPKKAEKKPQPEKAAGPEKEAAPEEGTSAEELTEEKVMEKPEVTVIPAEELDPEEVSIEMGTDAEGNVYGSMMGDTLGILIGRRGETLDALQYLTSLKVNRGREGYTRVTLDTENYRARREDTLIRLANRMANRATRTGRRVSLEPMNPYERRIIHFALQQNESVTTHSEGDEPNRHVVITVKK